MATHRRYAQRGDEAVSIEELRTLEAIRQGNGSSGIPPAHKKRFVDLGWIEAKFGGAVLTAVGRYQLDIRARESGLSLLAQRWRRRAELLHRIGTASSDGAGELRQLAARWEAMADQIEALEKTEGKAQFLT